MDWNEFYRSVKEGRFERIYLFTGPEELNKREALAALRRKLLPAGLEQLNDTTLEGCGARDIITAAETLPLMCDRRVVVVRDWGPLTPGKARNEEADVSAILEWMKDAPDTCVLVFYMTVEIDGRKKLTAALNKMPGYVEFGRLNDAQLSKWCAQHLRKENKRISPDALSELCMMAGQDLTRLSGEIKKLAAYTGDAEEIGVEDVRAVVSPSSEYSVFMILDHLLEGRLKEATEVVNAELRNDNNPVRLISLLSSQLRIDAHVKYVMEAKGNIPKLLKSLGVSDYRYRRIRQQIQAIPAEALKERYLHCVDADYAIKSGKLHNRAALDMLMLKIVMPAKATKSRYASSKR